jgi:hypothetical protein
MKLTVIAATATLAFIAQPAAAREHQHSLAAHHDGGNINSTHQLARHQADRTFAALRNTRHYADASRGRGHSKSGARAYAMASSSETETESGGYGGGYGPRPAAWCGWEMRHLVSADPGPSYNLAANWAHWGRSGPAGVGAVVVWPHHVGKIVGREGGQWVVESGNDGHQMRTRARSIDGAIAFRWG